MRDKIFGQPAGSATNQKTSGPPILCSARESTYTGQRNPTPAQIAPFASRVQVARCLCITPVYLLWRNTGTNQGGVPRWRRLPAVDFVVGGHGWPRLNTAAFHPAHGPVIRPVGGQSEGPPPNRKQRRKSFHRNNIPPTGAA